MRASLHLVVLLSLVVSAYLTPAASAASKIVEAGQTLTLTEDLVLQGDDVLEIRGTKEMPCTLVGSNQRIRTEGNWTGAVRIRYCTLKKLGAEAKLPAGKIGIAAEFHAFDLKCAGKAEFAVENCTLDECSSLVVQSNDESSFTFRNNIQSDNATVHIDKDLGSSADFLKAGGTSKGKKLFQGNLITRGKIFCRGANWLIGGDTDADSNLFMGTRIGVVVDGQGSIVRGNYFHLFMPKGHYWSQVSVFTTGKDVLAEHNVIRDGEWIVRFVDGEFRNNIVMDILDHDLMQNGSIGRIHHNLFIAGTTTHGRGEMYGSISVIYAPKPPSEGIEIHNNVFDGGGWMDVPAVEVGSAGFVKSLRNNVFYDFGHKEKYFKLPQAMIRHGSGDDGKGKGSDRLGYADYNLFYSPKVENPRNYLLTVAGKTERKDAGFALNDVPKGGPINEQVNPRFKGPIPKGLPFDDADIRVRKVTVSQILTHYRDAYSPAEGSPLIGAGDPADGAGTNIGVVGSGSLRNDQFGRFGSKK